MLPAILKEFSRFSSVSNFKVNLSKTILFNVSLDSAELTAITSHFSFPVISSSLRYLGIKLTRDPADLFSYNFLPLLQRTKSDLVSYDKPYLGWFG